MYTEPEAKIRNEFGINGNAVLHPECQRMIEGYILCKSALAYHYVNMKNAEKKIDKLLTEECTCGKERNKLADQLNILNHECAAYENQYNIAVPLFELKDYDSLNINDYIDVFEIHKCILRSIDIKFKATFLEIYDGKNA